MAHLRVNVVALQKGSRQSSLTYIVLHVQNHSRPCHRTRAANKTRIGPNPVDAQPPLQSRDAERRALGVASPSSVTTEDGGLSDDGDAGLHRSLVGNHHHARHQTVGDELWTSDELARVRHAWARAALRSPMRVSSCLFPYHGGSKARFFPGGVSASLLDDPGSGGSGANTTAGDAFVDTDFDGDVMRPAHTAEVEKCCADHSGDVGRGSNSLVAVRLASGRGVGWVHPLGL